MANIKQAPRATKKSLIEDNVPLPKYTKMPKSDLVDDLKKMKPMQSRVIDIDFSDEKLNAMRTRINSIQKRTGLEDRKFTVNVDPVSGKKLRVWRVQ